MVMKEKIKYIVCDSCTYHGLCEDKCKRQ